MRGALVLLDALAREDAGVDDDAGHARRHLERGVANVAGLLTEDGAKQLLLRRELGLALRRDLADQDVAGVHLGADPHDARLVEVLEGLLADVRDVAGDFFLAELGVASDALELLDVHRGVDVVLDDPLGEQDRVLEVVSTPRHERDDHVLAECQLAAVGAGAVGDDVARLDLVPGRTIGVLVDAGVLVGALELVEAVDVAGTRPQSFGLDDDARRVDRFDHAVRLRDHANTRVARDPASMPVPTIGACVRTQGTA